VWSGHLTVLIAAPWGPGRLSSLEEESLQAIPLKTKRRQFRQNRTPAVDNRGNAVIKVKFSTKDCRRCDHVA
jgi:hypothetical protein